MADEAEKGSPQESPEQAPASSEQQVVLARDTFPSRLPILPLDIRPLFPKMTAPLIISDANLREMLLAVARQDAHYVGLILRREYKEGVPATAADLYGVGVIAEVLQIARPPVDGHIQVILGAHERIKVDGILQEQPHIVAATSLLVDKEFAQGDELKAYSLALIQGIRELVELNPLHKEELKLLMSPANLSEPARLADYAAALTSASGAELQEVLETADVHERLKKSLYLIKKEIDLSKIQAKITKQIEERISRHQRDFLLREQLKEIKKELGLEKEGKEADIEKFEERLKALAPPAEALERIHEELDKLRMLEPASPEFHVARTYVDWLTILPWGVVTPDSFDLAGAEKVLDEDHYGLADVKERILEFLSVGIRKGSIAGSILLFVGPPGVGKTSLGHSIARSIGRNFYRFSLGGIRDEAEIKGHRRTYIGALPGKFIQAMRTCKSSNPVIMLDEVDKIGASFQGDPASALLEVLDPEQNSSFLDHYLDVRFDLSNVFFICTANQTDTIPRPLLDRMEMIKLPGYILPEKLEIARRFLIPKQLRAHGVTRRELSFGSDAIREIIDGYAREPGVRGLEMNIKKIIRKGVKKIVKGSTGRIAIAKESVPEYLGARTFMDDHPYKKPRVGVVTGLAWTSMGGETLHIEATKVRTGTSGFKQTGQLGNVMVESSEIAYTYVRSLLDSDPAMRDFFKESFIHLHVPAGATPKDGPSAGITMATALYSLATQKTTRPHFAMTGELTLVGNVMPVGGIKEKTVAAKRAKIKHLIFPEQNRKDFDEVPAHVRQGLEPHFVRTFEEVIALVF